MNQSIATQIIDYAQNSLQAIRQGRPIPGLPAGSPQTFNTTIRWVTRSASAPRKNRSPLLVLMSASTTTRHMLSDLRQAMMTLYVSGIVQSSDDKNPAANQVSALSDDVLAVLSSDPTFGGLARRSRIVSFSPTPEVEEPEAAFIVECGVDYIEMMDSVSGTFNLEPIAVDAGLPQVTQITQALFNALLTMPGIVWVERADIWPVPSEQISRQYTPGVWFKEQTETYEYKGSTETIKMLNTSLLILAVDSSETYLTTLDTWVANIKQVFGLFADLSGLVNAIDIKEIRTAKSEFPLVHIEVDIAIRYVQSFLIA